MKPGASVQTPFGKGIVREVRNRDRVLVDVAGRALVFEARELAPLDPGRRRARPDPSAADPPAAAPVRRAPGRGETGPSTPRQVDLHGLTVEAALAVVDDALNEALLADIAELRFIHGRTGGRLRSALHRRLREIPAVRHFRIDPRNAGVTIVSL